MYVVTQDLYLNDYGYDQLDEVIILGITEDIIQAKSWCSKFTNAELRWSKNDVGGWSASLKDMGCVFVIEYKTPGVLIGDD